MNTLRLTLNTNKNYLNAGIDFTGIKVIRRSFISYCRQSIVLCLLVLCCLQVSAQNVAFEWVKGIGGNGADEAYGIATDNDGNVYITGRFNQAADFDPGTDNATLTPVGNYDIFLAKYDANGNYIWAKGFGSTGIDWSYGVAVDNAGNAYIAGSYTLSVDFDPGPGTSTFTSFGSDDIFIAKYDPNGNYLWAKGIGGPNSDAAYDITVDGTGNAYITGRFNSTLTDRSTGNVMLNAVGSWDVFVVKYNTNGNYIWAKNMGGAVSEQGDGIAIDPMGNVYVTGQFNSPIFYPDPGGTMGPFYRINGADAFFAKYDSNGNIIWTHYFDHPSQNIYGRKVVADPTGNLYLLARIPPGPIDIDPDTSVYEIGALGGVGSDLILIKYDSSGKYLWVQRMGGNSTTEDDVKGNLAIDNAGNVYVSGWLNGTGYFGNNKDSFTTSGTDAFIAKYDGLGNYLWSRLMTGASVENGYGVALGRNRNLYVTGRFNSVTADFNPGGGGGTLNSVASYDAFLLKLNQGCEQLVTLTASECDSFIFNGVAYTTSGIYRDTFISSDNCDSIVALSLTIKGRTSNNPIVSGHYCDSVTFNGHTYTNTGTYVQHYSNATGCDSNITYDITVGATNGSQLIEVACDSFVFNDTLVYTSTANHVIIFTNETGCDSTVVVNLTINNSPEASAILAGTTLTSNIAEHYQWVDCDNNYAPVPGATERSFTPTLTGNYAVIITNNNCSDTSDCNIVQIGTHINELGAGNQIQLYPNPTDGRVTIQMQQTLSNVTIRLVNILGQLLEEQTYQHGGLFTLDMTAYATGVYSLDISKGYDTVRLKLVKK